MPKTHPPYPAEFRQQIIELVRAHTEARLAVFTWIEGWYNPGDIIPRWDTYHLLISKGDRRPLSLNLMSNVRSPANSNERLGIKSITVHENWSTQL